MNFLFDTNILLFYIRENALASFIDRTYAPFDEGNTPILSIVSVGEIKSIALRNDWGRVKLAKLKELMTLFVITDINSDDVIDAYAEIDTYSQGKLKTNPLPHSARNMGKNDLWIAATASVVPAKLLTSDADFDHLEGHYLEIVKIEQ
ncbi:MAG: PIN domain-containing protein [Saprospiraceae bacterium]|nr:PIN domain-containing protein [Saprospiraceae bacterium]